MDVWITCCEDFVVTRCILNWKEKGMRLLLAEDEQELADALSMILKHSHYSVDVVYNGQDALDYLMGQEYDGAVMDIMMPKMDGITVLKKIRGAGNAVPVLLLTAKSGIDDKVEGLDSGANDYLPKPFDTRELLARVRAMTRQQTTGTDNQLRLGNVTLDRSSGRCFPWTALWRRSGDMTVTQR